MFMIYWTLHVEGQQQAHSKEFLTTEMGEALKFSEDLRKKRRNGEQINHIVMSSENPNSVGEQGVADVGPDYSWKKRRK